MIGTYTCKECGVTKAASSFYSSNRSVCISCLTKRAIEQRKDQKPKRYKVCSLCGRRIYMSAARYMRTEPRLICTSCQSTRKAKTTRGVNRIEAPCGRYMLPEKFGRCAEFMECRHYGECLRAGMLENWKGWSCAEKEDCDAGEIVLDGHGRRGARALRDRG